MFDYVAGQINSCQKLFKLIDITRTDEGRFMGIHNDIKFVHVLVKS